ncbi:MAG: hypothetical protein KGJ13_02125 [Patescibacteria group bacterium]|nr:hypothetical protein [Patescibacteria group bacterium]
MNINQSVTETPEAPVSQEELIRLANEPADDLTPEQVAAFEASRASARKTEPEPETEGKPAEEPAVEEPTEPEPDKPLLSYEYGGVKYDFTPDKLNEMIDAANRVGSMHADYTRKTQDLAAKRKDVERFEKMVYREPALNEIFRLKLAYPESPIEDIVAHVGKRYMPQPEPEKYTIDPNDGSKLLNDKWVTWHDEELLRKTQRPQSRTPIQQEPTRQEPSAQLSPMVLANLKTVDTTFRLSLNQKYGAGVTTQEAREAVYTKLDDALAQMGLSAERDDLSPEQIEAAYLRAFPQARGKAQEAKQPKAKPTMPQSGRNAAQQKVKVAFDPSVTDSFFP